VAFLPANLWIFLVTLALGSWLGQFILHRPPAAAPETVPAE
jgi:hypothetical protein